MTQGNDERSERGSPASLATLLGALVFLIVGGVLSGGTIVSLFERGETDLASAAVLFLAGVGLIAIAFLVVRRQA